MAEALELWTLGRRKGKSYLQRRATDLRAYYRAILSQDFGGNSGTLDIWSEEGEAVSFDVIQ